MTNFCPALWPEESIPDNVKRPQLIKKTCINKDARLFLCIASIHSPKHRFLYHQP